MKLIDADKLVEELESEYSYFSLLDMDKMGHETACHRSGINCGILTAINKAKNMATAYDPDKVVEQLEKASCYIEDGDGHAGHVIFTEKAIEIVKGGAV